MIPRNEAAPDSEVDLAHQELVVRSCGTRRALFAAASGLLIPKWPTDAEAREGALGGARGGRRGKNHRGRKRRRTHGDKKGKRQDRQPRLAGGDSLKSIAFTVRNFRPAAIQVQGWDMTQARDAFMTPAGWDWASLAALPAAGPALPATREYSGNSSWVAIRIGTNRLVYAMNHGPRPLRNGELADVVIGTGGWDSKGWRPRGVVRTESDPLDWGRSITADGITVTRLDDSPDHLRYAIDLT